MDSIAAIYSPTRCPDAASVHTYRLNEAILSTVIMPSKTVKKPRLSKVVVYRKHRDKRGHYERAHTLREASRSLPDAATADLADTVPSSSPPPPGATPAGNQDTGQFPHDWHCDIQVPLHIPKAKVRSNLASDIVLDHTADLVTK